LAVKKKWGVKKSLVRGRACPQSKNQAWQRGCLAPHRERGCSEKAKQMRAQGGHAKKNKGKPDEGAAPHKTTPTKKTQLKGSVLERQSRPYQRGKGKTRKYALIIKGRGGKRGPRGRGNVNTPELKGGSKGRGTETQNLGYAKKGGAGLPSPGFLGAVVRGGKEITARKVQRIERHIIASNGGKKV